MNAIKLLARINKRCATQKRNTLKNAVARVVYFISSVLINVIITIIDQITARSNIRRINAVATVLTQNSNSQISKANELCRFVNAEVLYFPFKRWLSPETVLWCGIGDCKNQAQLLRELMASIGIESEISVGVIDKVSKFPRIHAWLNFTIEGKSMVADPTISGDLMSIEEYKNKINGFIDVTDEYRKTRRALACTS